MAKKPGVSLVKKIVIVCGALIVFEGIFLFFYRDSKPATVRQAIDNALKKIDGLDHRRREQMRVQLALHDFIAKNEGKPPNSLDELRPVYFDAIPIDPATGKVFQYKVENNQPYVGYDADVDVKTASKGTTEEELMAIEKAENEAEAEKVAFVYDPTGKRDPFRPFDMSPRNTREGMTPLEKYDYGQLKLTAVLGGGQGSSNAIVENSVGKGFTVKKGTKIGPNGGEVVEILPDKLLILETITDFTGETKTQTIEMRLRTKDQTREP